MLLKQARVKFGRISVDFELELNWTPLTSGRKYNQLSRFKLPPNKIFI